MRNILPPKSKRPIRCCLSRHCMCVFLIVGGAICKNLPFTLEGYLNSLTRPLTRPIVILLKLNTPEFLSDLFLAHIYLTNKPRVVATACSLDQISVIYQRDIRWKGKAIKIPHPTMYTNLMLVLWQRFVLNVL